MPKSCVVIDDDESTVEVMLFYFRYSGWRCHGFSTASEALELILVQPPSIVLMDYYLKEKMCLREFVRLVKQRSVRIILISGAIGIEKRAVDLGVDAYFQKPFDFNSLEKTCCSMVGLTA